MGKISERMAKEFATNWAVGNLLLMLLLLLLLLRQLLLRLNVSIRSSKWNQVLVNSAEIDGR